MTDEPPIRLVDASPDSAVGPPPGYLRRQADLPVRDDWLHVELDVREGATARLSDAVPVLRRIDDRLVDIYLRQAADEGREIHCRKGCQPCCHSFLLMCSPAEMYRTVDLLDRIPAEMGERARRWLAGWAAEIRRSGLLATLHHLPPGQRPTDVIEQWWNRQSGTTCPFLDTGEGICGIYEERFLCCREFYSLRPPSACAAHQTSRLPIPLTLQAVPCALEERLTGLPVGSITVPELMLWYEIRTGEAHRAWPAVEVADEMLGALADEAGQAQQRRASARVERDEPDPAGGA